MNSQLIVLMLSFHIDNITVIFANKAPAFGKIYLNCFQ
jgi:hypothetical protein